MSPFGDNPHAFFESVYQAGAPWDIGGPQPAMEALLKRFPPTAPILDLGCGAGDLAIYLAVQGFRATGIDFIATAIEQANERRAALPAETSALVDFQVADGLQPASLGMQFGAVVDSGFYHLFDVEQCRALTEEVANVLGPHGRYYLHEFAVSFDIPNVPRKVTAEELRTLFTEAQGWKILEIADVDFHSNVAPPVAGIVACVERIGA